MLQGRGPLAVRVVMTAVLVHLLVLGMLPAGAHFVNETDPKNDTSSTLLDIHYGAFIHCHRYGPPCVVQGKDRIIGVQVYTYGRWGSRQLHGDNAIYVSFDTKDEKQYVDRFVKVAWRHGRLVARMIRYVVGAGTEVVGHVSARRGAHKKAVRFLFPRRFFGKIRASRQIGWAIQTNTPSGLDYAPDGFVDEPHQYYRHYIRD